MREALVASMTVAVRALGAAGSARAVVRLEVGTVLLMVRVKLSEAESEDVSFATTTSVSFCVADGAVPERVNVDALNFNQLGRATPLS